MKGISEKTLIKIKDLKASVKLNNGDRLTTVTNANMELQRGRSYAIVGKSGSGKTSLISIIGLLNR
ncbi:ATP-binding cassette domain-containing protein [Roseburia inulinivorans]|jgi:putative ABC transport system ATP-binding protein|nr:ATP-binding cassette domain-containing protein [Roseburia inulinivorans]